MASTCNQLLDLCLRGEPWSKDLLHHAIAEDEGRALLSIVVERLGDLFEPRLCDVYAKLFTEVILAVAPDLAPRTRRFTTNPEPPDDVNRVYILSRVTLGADVAVTSVLIDAAKQKFPSAEIMFVGPQKNFELFEADPRIRHFPAPYARSGALADRLQASASLWFDDGIVIDPDSRLTQLGLLRVCPDERYFFFESRSFGGSGEERLPLLAGRWAFETFGVSGASPYVAPEPPPSRVVLDPITETVGTRSNTTREGGGSGITVSLGVGENPAKRLDDAFERDLLQLLASTGLPILADKGGTPEERDRVERALQPSMQTHDGAFAPFASQIINSQLFVGYDSAAGHVASAHGIPLISIAQGFVNERMFQRWRPNGIIVRGDNPLEQVRQALQALSLL